MFACVLGMVVTYGLYTVSAETVALHSTERLIWTLPWVLLGSFRYLFRLHFRSGGGDPTLELLRDPLLAASALGWVATVAWLIARIPPPQRRHGRRPQHSRTSNTWRRHPLRGAIHALIPKCSLL